MDGIKIMENAMELYKDKDDNFYGYQKKGTEPTTKEYYDEVMLRKEEAYKATTEYKRAECQSYLIDTDWYAMRLVDTGKAIPKEIKAKRGKCRETLSRLK